MSILYVGDPPVSHQFYRIYQTREKEWVVCLAGRQGLGTRYFKPYKETFPSKAQARIWRIETLAESPNDYWVAPEGKYLLDKDGNLVPCRKTERTAIKND